MAIKFLSSENIAGDIDVTLSKNGITYLAVTNTDAGVSANARVQVVGESSQLDLVATSAGYTGVTGWADAGIISTDSGASGGLKLNSQAGGIQLQIGTTSHFYLATTGNVGINDAGAAATSLSVKDTQDTAFTSGISVIRSANSDVGYINMVGGAFNLNSTKNTKLRVSDTTKLEVRSSGINVIGETETDTLLCSGISTLANSVAIGGSFTPDRTLDVRGSGMSIYGTGDYTELMLRGQVEGTGTVRNVGAFHLSIRSDVGGDNDDLKFLRFVNGTYNGITMQISNSNGNATFFNDVNTTNRLAFKETTYGYSTSYKVLQLGSSGATSSISIGYDPNGNATGSFSGNEILIPNNIRILAPNAADDAFFGCMIFDSNNKLLLGSSNYLIENNNIMTLDPSTKNVGIGAYSPAGKLEVAGGTTYGFRLSNAGDQSAYDQVRMTYGGYNSGAPTVTLMPLTTPGSGNVDTTFHFMNTNGLNANNNRANVNIDGILYVGSGRQSGETTLIMRNYDATLVDTGSIQNSIRMSGRYWSGSASQLVETRINSVHQLSNGNGGSALTFWTQTGGSAPNEKLRIDKDGKVIVYQHSNISGFYLDGGNTRLYANGGGGTDYRGIECNSSGMWSWGETGTNNYFAKPVGIGITSPASKLDINGGRIGIRNNIVAASNLTYSTIYSTENTGAAYPFTGTSGNLVVEPRNGQDFVVLGTSGVAKMVVKGGGNVGIGTTSPLRKLHIDAGSDYPLRVDSTQQYLMEFARNGTSEWWLAVSGGFKIHQNGVGDHMIIQNGGNVGIGTTSPSVKFQVQQDQASESNVIFMNNSTSAGAAMRLTLNVGSPAGNDPMISFNIGDGGFDWTMGVDNSDSDKFKISGGTDSHNPNLGTNDRLTIDSSGTLTMSGDVVAYSDERLKTNIETLDGSKVYKMRGVSFNKDNKQGSGVIAQELEKVAPELVNNDNEYKGVAYGNLTGYLIEAIKELKAEVEELKKQIN